MAENVELERLTRQLDALQQRLERLEGKPSARAADAGPPEPTVEPGPAAAADQASADSQIPVVTLAETAYRPPRPGQPGPAPIAVARRSASEILDLTADELERIVGLKWSGWIGAIVFVVGAGLGIKFAFDQNWFERFPWMPLVLLALVGFALLAAGEAVYRRVHVVSATGLFGAGISVLFLTCYTGNIYFEVYSYQTAFFLTCLTTLVGSGVAIRGRLVVIAVLSQIGGQIAPIVLNTGQPPGVPLLGYLFMLQMVALILCLWGNEEKWWALRFFSFVATSCWVIICLQRGRWGPGPANELLWFSLLYAAAYQGELLRSALRWHGALSQDDDYQGWGMIFSTLVAAAVTALALRVFYLYDSAAWRGATTLGLAGLTLANAALVPGRNSRTRDLVLGYAIQATALVILFVPVTFTGVWINLAWGVLALTFAALAVCFGHPVARPAALLCWLLALVRLLIDTSRASHGGEAGEVWLVLIDHPVRGCTVLAWIQALVGLTLAVMLRNAPDRSSNAGELSRVGPDTARLGPPIWELAAVIMSVLASTVWLIGSLNGLPPLGATVALLLWSWLLLSSDQLAPCQETVFLAMAAFSLAALKWIVFDVASQRLTPTWTADLPIFNAAMGSGALLVGSLALFGRIGRPRLERVLALPIADANWRFTLTVIGAAILVAGLSFEADRVVERSLIRGYIWTWPVLQVKLFGLTWLWLYALLLLGLIARRLKGPTAWLWLVLGLVAGKFLLVDMLAPRLERLEGPVPVRGLLNAQVLTGLAVVAAVFLLQRLLDGFGPVPNGPVYALAFGNLILLIVLIAGTLEIDRAYATSLAAGLKDPVLAKQMGISIFWALFALAAVVAGFRRRQAWLRYFGLVLFAVAVMKVIGVDLSQVRYGYRVLSLLGLGLLLLFTSILYGKRGTFAAARSSR